MRSCHSCKKKKDNNSYWSNLHTFHFFELFLHQFGLRCSGQRSVEKTFARIVHICSNCQMYFLRLLFVFVQISLQHVYPYPIPCVIFASIQIALRRKIRFSGVGGEFLEKTRHSFSHSRQRGLPPCLNCAALQILKCNILRNTKHQKYRNTEIQK